MLRPNGVALKILWIGALLRKSIARWFSVSERHGRYLTLGFSMYKKLGGFKTCHFWRAINSRTGQVANDLADAGFQFLHAHLLLTVLSMRPGAWKKIVPNDLTRFCRRLQQLPGNLRHKKTVRWLAKPKLHFFSHQLLLVVSRRENTRHSHCFTDEDAMRWLKTIARKTNATHFEKMVLRASRLRLKLTTLKSRFLNQSAAQRSKR